jgi:hypothetical protein
MNIEEGVHYTVVIAVTIRRRITGIARGISTVMARGISIVILTTI